MGNIHYVISGSVGAPLTDPLTASYVLLSRKDYSYCIFDTTPTTLVMSVYNKDGVLIDTLTLNKTLGPADVNGDGVIDRNDCQWMMDYLSGNRQALAPNTGDLNVDGKIDSVDTAILWRNVVLSGKSPQR